MATNVTDSEAFENSVNNSRVAHLMKQRDLVLAKEAQNRRRRQEFHKDLNYPHTLAEERFVRFGGDLGSIGGSLVGAGAGVILVDNVQALQDPTTLAALNADRALRHRREHLVPIQHRRHELSHVHPLQALLVPVLGFGLGLG